MSQNVSIIPEFRKVFNAIPVDNRIVSELSRHNKTDQRKIFNTFQEIFEDELLFVLTIMNMPNHVKSTSFILNMEENKTKRI